MPDQPDDLGLGALAATSRPLPIALRDRLEVALLTDGAEPRPLPPALRTRLEHALVVHPPVTSRWRTLCAVAAAILLIGGSVTLVVRSGRGTDRVRVAGRVPTRTTTTETDATVPGATAGAGASVSTANPAADALARKSVSSALGTATSPWPSPPFTASATPAASQLAAGSSSPSTPQPSARAAGPPLKVAVVRGDDAEVAGFEAYVNRLNAAGGAGGHRFTLVTATSAAPARDAVATVNLSGSELAASGGGRPGWVSGPLLETVATGEATLAGDVYDFASSLERQAHLIADAMVPARAPGLRAVIYKAASGPYSSAVPSALAAVLRARGVEPTMVTSGAPPVFVPADVAFVSLDTADAVRWFGQAHQMNYAPARGIAGIGDLYDPAVLTDARAGTQVLAPYGPAASPGEVAALQDDTHRPLSTAVIHGWVSAKALAYAVWLASASDATGVRDGLDRLPSSSFTPGFAPPYGVRSGTHSRTPEGILLTVRNGAFAPTGDFRTDHF